MDFEVWGTCSAPLDWRQHYTLHHRHCYSCLHPPRRKMASSAGCAGSAQMLNQFAARDNCFDLDRYFATTPFDDIKFGRRWEIPDGENWKSGDELAIYTRWDFEHRTRWWTQLGQHEAPNAVTNVMEWVARCTRTTGPGDVVSIILIGHGTPSEIYLGGSLLTPESLASGCSSLHPDVQVNIVVKCCYSGSFLRGV